MLPSISWGTASSPASAPSRSSSPRKSSASGSKASSAAPHRGGPGIFYVFRDDSDEQSFAVNRVARQRRLPVIEQCQDLVADHEEAIEPLIAFVTERGRLPVDGELSTAPELTQLFDTLPDDLLHDIRAFFGSYRAGCTEADPLLFSAGDPDAVDRACRDAPVGKLLPDALYVHRTAVEQLSLVLRVFEGCGRQLAGTVDGVTLVKLFHRRVRVSYLVYADFDRVAHPALRKRSRRRPDTARHPLS